MRTHFCLKTAIIAALFLASVSQGTAQQSARVSISREVDSMLAIAARMPDSSAAAMYNNICWKVRNSSPDSAIVYASRAIDCAEKSDQYEQLVKGYSYIGVCQRNLGNYSEALSYYAKGLDYATRYGVKDQEAYAHINIANIYLYNVSGLDMAESNLRTALSIAEELKDTAILGYCYLNLGRVELGRRDFDKADSNFSYSLALRTQCPRLHYQILVTRKYLADSHLERGLVDKAFEEYNSCLADHNIDNDFDLISDITHKVSRIYFTRGNYDSALSLGQRSLYYSKLVGSKFSIMNAYDAIGQVYLSTGQYKEASDHFRSQIIYNDSIFSDKLNQITFNIQYSAHQKEKEGEIRRLALEKKISQYFLVFLGLIIIAGVVVVILVIRSNKKVKMLNTTLVKQQKQIADSISYAQRIQTALLPSHDEFGNVFKDSFVYYVPRNVVSGDFFWQHDDPDFQVIVCADCTGHGVPGAFMSMLGISALHEIVEGGKEYSAGAILNKLRDMVKTLLKQNLEEDGQPKDGMDIALVVVNKRERTIEYSGGNIPLIYIRNGQLHQLKPSHNPIGVYIREVPFESQMLEIQDGDQIYLSSDGYSSQFGGPKGDKIKMSGYKEVLLKNCGLPMSEQRRKLEEYFVSWMGKRPQVDDILVVGLQA